MYLYLAWFYYFTEFDSFNTYNKLFEVKYYDSHFIDKETEV